MKELYFDQCQNIVRSNSECSKIYFVASGAVEVIIHNSKNECCQLDVLRQGDVFGSYSILSNSLFKYDANALSKTKIYIIEKQFLLDNLNKI